MSERQTILIVEDDEDLRRLFRTALSLAGYDVIEAGDGLEALQRIEEAPPRLVVLDLMLPGFNGVTVRQELAAHAPTRHIPVVVITGTHVPDDLDVDCVLRKPIAVDELLTAVQRSLASQAGGAV
ncbi:MAG TPA: response regulator [Vicinamibacterales bacterium]